MAVIRSNAFVGLPAKVDSEMKTLFVLLVMLLTSATSAVGETNIVSDATLEARIIALDKQGWEAWKNKDAAWFEVNTTEDFISISSGGISNKHEVVEATPTECDVEAFSLADFKFIMLDENAVLLTYTVIQDAVCSGKKAPASLRVAVNYVRRGGRWLEAMYMQAP